jgi:hypothetical protein
MALQRFTIKLTQLRCIKESDDGPAKPYIWVTYFALGPQVPQFQSGPLALNTPSFDAFRTEFPDNVTAGSVVGIPPFIASAGFDMDLATVGPKLLGCVAVLMEEDDTRHRDILFGRIAYSKEMETQLNDLMRKRLQTGDRGPLTAAEIETIHLGVTSKVSAAIGSGQSFFDLFRNQDDALGFTHKIFPGETIRTGPFDFPEIITIKGSSEPTVTDRYVLSGEVTITAVPAGPVVVCVRQRAALDAKRQQINSLQTRVGLLQQQLHTATPQQKSAIVRQIKETKGEIDLAETQLPTLDSALNKCLADPPVHVEPVGGTAAVSG